MSGLVGPRGLPRTLVLGMIAALLPAIGCVSAPGLPALSSVLAIAGSTDHVCALEVGGMVRCWGENRFGQLGDGTTGDIAERTTRVLGLDDATAISTGSEFSCALRRSGSAVCWGFNLDGQLGNGEKDAISTSPVEVEGLVDLVGLAAGGNHVCALRRNGRVACWGGNQFGQLGGRHGRRQSHPVEVDGIDDGVQVTAGMGYSCVLHESGSVSCWGLDSLGQLGDGRSADRATPKPVTGLADATSIYSGLTTSCAVIKQSAVECWGRDDMDSIRDLGSEAGGLPRRIADGTAVLAVVVGEEDLCFVAAGRVSCRRTGSLRAVRVERNARDIDQIAIGPHQVCTARRNGQMACFRLD